MGDRDAVPQPQESILAQAPPTRREAALSSWQDPSQAPQVRAEADSTESPSGYDFRGWGPGMVKAAPELDPGN
jgi:hypothetical protein